MRIDKISDGVFRASDLSGLITVKPDDYSWLVDAARGSKKRRARICFHKPDDSLHVMVIALMRDTQVEMHRHKGCESQLLIRGGGEIETTDESGNVVIRRFDSANSVCYVRPGIMHRPVVRSDYMIVMESKDAE